MVAEIIVTLVVLRQLLNRNELNALEHPIQIFFKNQLIIFKYNSFCLTHTTKEIY